MTARILVKLYRLSEDLTASFHSEIKEKAKQASRKICRQHAARRAPCFLGFILDPEDGGSTFLRNVSNVLVLLEFFIDLYNIERYYVNY
jgi:hypothetical protein